MKISVINLLRAGAFSLAALMAVAFTTPGERLGRFGFDQASNSWIDVDNLPPGAQYTCNSSEQQVCLRTEPEATAPVEQNGIFSYSPPPMK